MSEAEVSLRLAFWLIKKEHVSDDVFVAVDARVVEAGKFDVVPFLRENHWRKTDSAAGWQGEYHQAGAAFRLVVRSKSEYGDLVGRLKAGRDLRVEATRGPLTTRADSEERRLTLEVLGQLLTIRDVSRQAVLAVALPYSPRFAGFAERWREAPLIQRFGIHILVVGRDGQVDGFPEFALDASRRHQEAAAVQETLDDMVKGVLSRVTPDFPPVKPAEYPAYIDFARQARRAREKWGDSLTGDRDMAELVKKWTSKGCAEELLLRIAHKCLDWVPPEDRPATPSPN